MLGKRPQSEEEPVVLGKQEVESGSDRDDDDEQDALRRALEQDPSLVDVHPELLQSVANKSRAAQLKDKGNKAFAAGQYEPALECFTQCAELDPTYV
jgi:tetratricopeptide (TPR) repeat protein